MQRGQLYREERPLSRDILDVLDNRLTSSGGDDCVQVLDGTFWYVAHRCGSGSVCWAIAQIRRFDREEASLLERACIGIGMADAMEEEREVSTSGRSYKLVLSGTIDVQPEQLLQGARQHHQVSHSEPRASPPSPPQVSPPYLLLLLLLLFFSLSSPPEP